MEILYSDNDIAVIIKPIGILSQSDSIGGESIISKLTDHFGCEIHPLYRLDKQVGGAQAGTECEALGRQARKIFNENFCPVTQTKNQF